MQVDKPSVLFLYLTAFSKTGGIEKFNRAFMQGLSGLEDTKVEALSCYDGLPDERYISSDNFSGFKGNRLAFIWQALRKARTSETIILGHINLSVVGLLLGWLFPSKKVFLIAHGIEVWNIRSFVQKTFIRKVAKILAVSSYTRDRILAHDNLIEKQKVELFYNTLDPYFTIPASFEKPLYLQQRYHISPSSKIILTIARLSDTEKFKGYDRVLEALPEVIQQIPDTCYLLCGKYTPAEKVRIDALIKEYGLENHVRLPGFIAEDEITDHYLLADVFVMPSKKEGFGIVFVEALACGASVIAGNKDGSGEASLNGKLGVLVDPDNTKEIAAALINQLLTSKVNKTAIQQEVISSFGFEAYKKRVSKILQSSIHKNLHGATV